MQLHAGFTFDDLREIIPYLADLGISHVYCSPYFAAVPGSSHGYDILDHNRINPELGGEQPYRRFVATLEAHRMGHITDFVPNHTGIEGNVNPRWWEMLRDGRESPSARFFDVDWQAEVSGGTGKVILPFLGDRVEALIERGELAVATGDGGEPQLRYYDHRFPLSPSTLPERLRDGGADAIDAFNAHAGSAEHRERFEQLLAAQHYQLAYWREAKASVNYRRFFEIDTLAALRQEDPDVFEETHRWIRAEVEAGHIDGVRIDHPDGLRDPAGYLERLSAWDAGNAQRPYVLVEKILEGDETLPGDWAVDGTTGYEFMSDAAALFVDPAGAAPLTELAAEVTGATQDFGQVAYEARLGIVRERFAGIVGRLAHRLFALTPEDERRDVTADDLAEAFATLLACFPVYRTYHREASDDPRAPGIAAKAVAEARERRPELPGAGLDIVARLVAEPPRDADGRRLALDLQQICPAVQAKGVEDTAFYRHARLLSLNEVGGDPGRFGADVARFHARNAHRHEHWPRSMATTATHDHKRGEDVRARLHVLSELPGDWAADVRGWRELAATIRETLPGDAPDGFDEYVFYQSLVGIWPASTPGVDEHRELIERLGTYLVKAAREGARRTSWLDPDEAYEAALTGFIERMLDPAAPEGRAFLEQSARMRSLIARRGAVNSLAQVLLRVTSPGVPDCYQGTESWDLSLVDPDNRRPVDYQQRRDVLDALRPAIDGSLAAGQQAARAAELLDAWPNGRVKAYVLATTLAERRRQPNLFVEGSYRPLHAQGARARHLVAFARELGDSVALILVPRLPHGLIEEDEATWRPRWEDTRVDLPAEWTGRSLIDRVTGRSLTLPADRAHTLLAGDVLDVFPVALLIGDDRAR